MVAVFAAITTPALADNHTQHHSKHVECTCTEHKQTQCEHKDDCKNCQHCTENKNCNCKNCQHHKANGATCANCQDHCLNCDENCNNCNKKCTDCDNCKCCEHKKSLFSKLKFW